MPPKKDKSKNQPEGIVVEGTNISELDSEPLMKFFINQVKELCQVKKQRSFEEEERDMYFRQIESAREGLSKQEAEYIIRKKAVQDISDHQYLELKVDKQRASHLKYELEKEVQAEAVHQDNEAREAARQRMLDKAEVAEETSYIKKRSADEALAFQQNMKELTSKLKSETQDIRKNFTEALEDRSEFIVKERKEAEEEARIDLLTFSRKIDQQHQENIHHLQINFERNFADVKRYFQELIYHNLSMVDDLKAQSAKVKGHINNLVNRLHGVQSQNKRYREPMRMKQAHLTELKKQVNIHHKDEAATERVCQEITNLKAERGHLKQEIEKLQDEFLQLQAVTKDIRENHVPASVEAKQYIGAAANISREKTFQLKMELDRLKVEIKNCAASETLNPQEFLDEIEDFESQCLDNIAAKRDLQQTAVKMAKVYNDSLQTVRFLIEEYHLSIADDYDLEPLKLDIPLAKKPAEITRLRQQKHNQPL